MKVIKLITGFFHDNRNVNKDVIIKGTTKPLSMNPEEDSPDVDDSYEANPKRCLRCGDAMVWDETADYCSDECEFGYSNDSA